MVQQGCDDVGKEGYKIHTGHGRVNFGKSVKLARDGGKLSSTGEFAKSRQKASRMLVSLGERWAAIVEQMARRFPVTVSVLVAALVTWLALLGLADFPAEQAAHAAQRPSAGFYQDFRSGQRPAAPLELCGRDPETFIRPEDAGLRVTLPAGQTQHDSVGVQLNLRTNGDFEITAGYELLQANRPSAGHGVGCKLTVMAATPTEDAIDILRLARVNEGDAYACTRISSVNGERRYETNVTGLRQKSVGQAGAGRQEREMPALRPGAPPSPVRRSSRFPWAAPG